MLSLKKPQIVELSVILRSHKIQAILFTSGKKRCPPLGLKESRQVLDYRVTTQNNTLWKKDLNSSKTRAEDTTKQHTNLKLLREQNMI